ncbi:DUF7266 family protein [Halorubrum sp. DTA98]|uniref:DUF7266 family protein n=1 Tax=Halorubrum sp. DTA98 TaxID=3402163 RepID=UPI003AAD1E64
MGDRGRAGGRSTERAVTPMIAKTLEAGIVVLFIGVITTGLYAGVVPDYRSATAADIGDRTVVAAGNEIESAIPPDAERVHVQARVDLPTAIRSERYRIVATGPEIGPGTTNATRDRPRIELDHPHSAVGGSYALALPEYVVDVRGEWSGGDGRIVVRTASDGDGVIVRLEDDE